MSTSLMRTIWVLAVVVLCAGAWASAELLQGEEESRWRIPLAADGVLVGRAGLGEVVRSVVASDPFRFERRPSLVPSGQVAVTVAPETRTIPVAPSVTGIIGPPWRAALEGINGRPDGLLVTAGDTVAGMRIVAIHRDTVVIAAVETTWRLPVRRP